MTIGHVASMDYCTTREAAERLGVSLRTAQLWVDSGLLEAWKTEGGHRRISIASVDRLKHTETHAPTAPAPADRLKILVVDDDNVLIKLYRTRIAAWHLPIDISTAANGYEALVLVGREQPDLMITELLMPGLDGFQMVRTLTTSSFREGMEIVIVTALAEDLIASSSALPASVRVLHKPVPFNELKAIAAALIARRAALARE